MWYEPPVVLEGRSSSSLAMFVLLMTRGVFPLYIDSIEDAVIARSGNGVGQGGGAGVAGGGRRTTGKLGRAAPRAADCGVAPQTGQHLRW